MPKNITMQDSEILKTLGRTVVTEGVNDEYLGRRILEQWFYEYAYERSCFSALRGTTRQSPIIHYELAQDDANTITHNILQGLDVNKIEAGYEGDPKQMGQTIVEAPFTMRASPQTLVANAKYTRAINEETLLKLASREVETKIRTLIYDTVQEAIDMDLLAAPLKHYSWEANAAMPLACRMQAGAGTNAGKYKYKLNGTMREMVTEALPVDCVQGGLNEDCSMSVKHIESLLKKALGIGHIGAGQLNGGILEARRPRKYFLFIDSPAREALLADSRFEKWYGTTPRANLSSGLIDPVHPVDYLGCVSDVEVYWCRGLDKLRIRGKRAGIPDGLSYSLFVGEGALVEAVKYVSDLNNNGVAYDSYKNAFVQFLYYHNAEAPRFPCSFIPDFREKDAAGNSILAYTAESLAAAAIPVVNAADNTQLNYTMPEVGLIHSITANIVSSDWSKLVDNGTDIEYNA